MIHKAVVSVVWLVFGIGLATAFGEEQPGKIIELNAENRLIRIEDPTGAKSLHQIPKDVTIVSLKVGKEKMSRAIQFVDLKVGDKVGITTTLVRDKKKDALVGTISKVMRYEPD